MRDQLAQLISRLQAEGADSSRIADAVLASPDIAFLQAEAWDLGFRAGRTSRRGY